MNLGEKKEELSFAHKLEVRRIWLSRGLAAGVTILVGVIAFLVAPRFAHELKLKEFEHQREVAIAKLWETSQIEGALEGFQLTDSLHRVAYNTYKEAVNGFELRGDDANFEASVRALREAAHQLSDVTQNYSIYWDDDFSKQAQINALIFQGIAEMRKSDWKKFQEFLWDLATIRYTLQLEFIEQKIRVQRQSIGKELFRLEDYVSPQSSMKGKRDYNIKFLLDNYNNWMKWKSSLPPVKE